MLRRFRGTAAALCLVVLAALVATAASQGDVSARGGNHGCDSSKGLVYSDHFFPSGDNVVAAYAFDEGGPPRGIPGGDDQEFVYAENSDDGANPLRVGCGGEPGTWRLFVSRLGPGDDSVRLDAKPLYFKYTSQTRPIPKRIKTRLVGGGGADRLLGHPGFDRLVGGRGPDVIKAVDRTRDIVRCGKGRDKAVVDSRDEVSGCERLIER